MTTTLPQFTRQIDNAFTTTWYEINADAADNIMQATNIWAMLSEKGRLTPQRGSEIITRTIDYALIAAEAVQPGVVFNTGTPQSKTMASWTYRHIATSIQRSLFEDRSNGGKFKIVDYVSDRLKKARKGLRTKFETIVMAAEVTAETGIEWQGLNDIVPAYANANAGTYGGINRPLTYAAAGATNPTFVPATGNTWWGPKYLAGTTPAEINLEQDLTILWNSIQNNQVNPDLIILDKYLIEIYEQFAVDKTQIVKNDNSASAQLGFVTFRFKGSDMTWTPNITAKNALILTTESLEVMYDPGMWFDMTAWKPVPNSTDSFAQILCSGNVICEEPRRNGRLYYS